MYRSVRSGWLDSEGRVYIYFTLEEMGIKPFAQPYRDYDGGEPSGEQKAFARWVNVRSVHRACAWEDYHDSRRRRNGR